MSPVEWIGFARTAASAGSKGETDGGADALEGASGIVVSTDSGQVAVTSWRDDALTVFHRDHVTGRLTHVETHQDGVGGITTRNGANAVVASADDGAISGFARDPATGRLVFGGAYVGLGAPYALAISTDGALVYVVSDVDDAVTIFHRNADTGELVFRQAVRDTDGGIDGLDGAYAVAVSPDGNNFYVAGYGDDAIVAFRWAGGFLSYVGTVKDGVGADGLDGANSVAVSPDGGYVYVASRQDDAVAILRREPATGALSYRGMVQDGVAGVDGLNGARALAVTPDGNQLYVASQRDDAFAIFDRAAGDGALRFVAAYKDGVAGLDGLDTADGIAISPDGGYIYVTSYGENAVTVFARFRAYLPLTLR